MDALRCPPRPCITYNGSPLFSNLKRGLFQVGRRSLPVPSVSATSPTRTRSFPLVSKVFPRPHGHFPSLSGSTGKASLYLRVWNIRCSEKQTREMMTGKHIVRDVECMVCGVGQAREREDSPGSAETRLDVRVCPLRRAAVQGAASHLGAEAGRVDGRRL